MPLSAAFHFFSPFHYKKKYHRTTFSHIHLLSFYSSFFLLYHTLYLLLSIPSFIGYIRNLALAN